MPIYSSVIPQQLFIDPIGTYGCAFDHRVVFDGACTVATSTTTINSATANFTNADLNKRIVLSGAGASGAQYVGTISAIQSTTAVTVTPVLTTTVATKGLQIHTDDLTAWTNLITDLNNSTYSGGIITIRSAWTATGFTNRSGISSFLPTINKQIRFDGIAGGHTSDIGDYTKVGGSCIAYVGTSNAPTAFGAVMTIAPVAGASNQNLKQVTLAHLWIDCRNGDQNEALKGLSMQSCFGFQLDDFYVQDPAAVGIEFLVISPGTSGALGEAKDCSRGNVRNVGVRCLDNPSGAVTTPFTTTSAITLSTTGQSLTVAANSLPTVGYMWVQTNLGYPVLVNYTGGGGTTTITGCTISLQDTINAPATVSGSNIVQAVPGNACGILLDGDATANANLNHFDTCAISHGATWGPAAIEFRNSDSNEMTNIVINGGSNASLSQPNRITKPGVRFNGSNTNQTLAARNNVLKSGSCGVGGTSNMGILNTAANLLAQSGPNYWDEYQMGNGEPIPTVEGNSFFSWNSNGGLGTSSCPSPVQASAAGQTLVAATATALIGSIVAIPPQGFQVGAVFRWTIIMTKTAAGVAARTFNIRVGTTGTATDGVVQAFASVAGSAAVDTCKVTIDYTITTIGTSATGVGYFYMIHPGTAGFMTVATQTLSGTATTFNSTTAQQFISVSLTTGAAEVPTINCCYCEVIKAANP